MQNYPFIHSNDDPDCTEAADNLQLISVYDCPPQPVQWLWPEKIPLGKVTLLIGDPGTGKSLVALDIAARASRGGPWPGANDEIRMTNDQKTEHSSFDIRHSSLPSSCSTLLLSASDDLADTIRPRLDAAGADARRVFVIPSIADLRDDFQQLRAAVSRAPNCRLIVIDPINAYVGPGDSHFQTVVRKVLAPLARLAAEKRIAVIAIAHLRKNEGDAIYRAAGSMGFVASARTVWSVSRDPENPNRHLLLPIKNNLGPNACGLAFTIQPTGHLAAPAIVWDDAPLNAKPERKRPPALSDERIEAREWLRRALTSGPRPSADVIEDGQQHGFLRRTLQRAFHELDGHTAKQGLHQGWWWSLADQFAETESVESPKNADIFEDVTFEHDIAAHEQFADVLTERPPVGQSIAAINRLDRHRHADRRANTTANGDKRPPTSTGHPILDAILNDFRNTSPKNSSQHADTS